MGAKFKTCLFGGFDRESVVAYIESTARAHREALDALEKELALLRQTDGERAQELETLRQDAQEGRACAKKYEELRALSDELSHRAETLAAENESLRADAEAYRNIKDHIAEIEISAHRRTEEFRAAAIARLHELASQQRAWCEEERVRLSSLHSDLRAQIEAAQQSLGQADLASLEEMTARLEALDRSFDANDA